MKVAPVFDSTALLVSLAFLGLAACGGSPNRPSPNPGSGGNAGAVDATVTMTANGVSQAEPRIGLGSRVRFTNNDSRVHQILSTPHGTHTDCPALNEIGILQPGQSKDSGVLNDRRGCGFHDHNDPDNTNFRGQVLVGLGANDPAPGPPAY